VPDGSPKASTHEQDVIAAAWAAVTAGESEPVPRPTPVRLTGPRGQLPSHFCVEEIATASVAVALLAASALSAQREGEAPTVDLDRGHVADAVRSERHFRVGGQPAGAGFAPLSRFWSAADGWVRTHANYPWHKRALLGVLGTPDDAGAVASALATLPVALVERRVVAAGGIAAAVRALDAWRSHPQGRALAEEPLIAHRVSGDGPPRRRPPADLPLSGVRVVDLTRVIAGPVCTRFLSALGAEVVRLDPPARPDMAPGAIADTLLGKRSAIVDLDLPEGLAALHALLAAADVVVCGYRPGALDRFELDERSLAERHPGVVSVRIDAWGHRGPWAERRGFDSVVQAPTGIALGESVAPDQPGALPCQLLDHATGYLAAAAAIDGLRRQAIHGGTLVRRLSLARTAQWLTSEVPDAPTEPGRPATERAPAWLVELDGPLGPVSAVAPPGTLAGRPLRWPFAPTGYGRDAARWQAG
jgi:hypothetical protein